MKEQQPARILIIEDEAVTARLLKKRLEQSDYVVEHVKDSEEGIARVVTESFDILVIDYSLPGRNGLEVIRILGAKGIFPPTIMVTGSGDERIAVEAMKLGAKDYIVKDDEGRYVELLPRVVERILSEKSLLLEKQRAEEALTETQARYKALFENTPLGLYRTTPDGQFLDANPALVQLLGFPDRESLFQMNSVDFYKDPLDRSRWKDMIERQGVVNGYEVEIIRSDGTTIWVEDNGRTIRDNAGKTLYYEGSLQNITERKKTEEEFRRMLVANATLAELSNALLSSETIEAISKLVLDNARALTGSVLGYVSYIDPLTGHHICAAMTAEIGDLFRIKEKEDMSGKLIGLWRWPLETKRPLLSNSASEDPRFAVHEQKKMVIHRVLSTPVLLGDRLLGQISVANASRDYTELDLSTTERLASIYAVAIERWRADDAIVRARDFYTTILEEFPTLIWRSGLEGQRDYFNKTWLGFTGRSLQEELGDKWMSGVHPDDAPNVLRSFQNAFRARKPFETEFRLRRYDGVYRWVIDSGRPFFDLEGKFAGFIGTCLDITEKKVIEEQLRDMSHRDGLTQLFNRSFFEEEMARIEKSRNYPVTILMVDVDELKKTNDTYGHAEGDKLLLRTAEVLRITFRPDDIVARIGGDEFAIILPGVDSGVALTAVNRLKSRLEEHNQSYRDRPLRLSVGTATASKSMPLNRVLREADERMYQDKISKASSFRNSS
ncbi:MAG: PAS domain S-box protein [Candidatus Aminicenantales bacterium]